MPTVSKGRPMARARMWPWGHLAQQRHTESGVVDDLLLQQEQVKLEAKRKLENVVHLAKCISKLSMKGPVAVSPTAVQLPCNCRAASPTSRRMIPLFEYHPYLVAEAATSKMDLRVLCLRAVARRISTGYMAARAARATTHSAPHDHAPGSSARLRAARTPSTDGPPFFKELVATRSRSVPR